MGSKKRDIRIEFIRGLSMFIICIYHYSCALEIKNIEEGWRPLWHFASSSWGAVFVIVFFMISGYVMMIQYSDSLDIKSFYKKRWVSIFPMFYIAWGIMYVVRAIQYKNPLWGGKPSLLILSLLGMDGYLKNGTNNYYTVGEWFLGAIIILYILFPLLRLIYKKNHIVFTIIMIFIFFLFEAFGVIEQCKRTDIFFCIFSFWCGMIFWKYRESAKKSIVIISALIIWNVMYFVDCRDFFNEITIMHMMGISAFILFYSLPIETICKNKKLENIISFLSKYSYPVMLVHHVLVYWGIKACQLIGIHPNIGIFFIIIGIYIAAVCFDKITKPLIFRITKNLR